jgi:Calcineurin-like phosphoesterase
MATIAVGDVHGNVAALDDLLHQLGSAVTEGDVVVFLGDYIDRGPNSKECVDAILGLQHDSAAEVVCLCGNHEDWFLRTQRDYRRHSWLLGMEALDTIRSYSVDAAQALRDAAWKAGPELYLGHCALPYEVFFDCVPQAHIDFSERHWSKKGKPLPSSRACGRSVSCFFGFVLSWECCLALA